MSENRRRQWHRLFGIGLTDLFAGSGWRVELERAALTHDLQNAVPAWLAGRAEKSLSQKEVDTARARWENRA
ncbi:MAG: hypothetical protein N838_14100 [Thiohalocapsa sp. PB-PSB1]|jgi:hypothetical protein|nr:MAG: hypothetical protein N838_27170 [Thiohalocapsa sp. PB-PSB1]QQO54301.1 MAG: hypothetical protein N838_14100 [Thiohalocapsa sp. PB-PSB1]